MPPPVRGGGNPLACGRSHAAANYALVHCAVYCVQRLGVDACLFDHFGQRHFFACEHLLCVGGDLFGERAGILGGGPVHFAFFDRFDADFEAVAAGDDQAVVLHPDGDAGLLRRGDDRHRHVVGHPVGGLEAVLAVLGEHLGRDFARFDRVPVAVLFEDDLVARVFGEDLVEAFHPFLGEDHRRGAGDDPDVAALLALFFEAFDDVFGGEFTQRDVVGENLVEILFDRGVGFAVGVEHGDALRLRLRDRRRDGLAVERLEDDQVRVFGHRLVEELDLAGRDRACRRRSPSAPAAPSSSSMTLLKTAAHGLLSESALTTVTFLPDRSSRFSAFFGAADGFRAFGRCFGGADELVESDEPPQAATHEGSASNSSATTRSWRPVTRTSYHPPSPGGFLARNIGFLLFEPSCRGTHRGFVRQSSPGAGAPSRAAIGTKFRRRRSCRVCTTHAMSRRSTAKTASASRCTRQASSQPAHLAGGGPPRRRASTR